MKKQLIYVATILLPLLYTGCSYIEEDTGDIYTEDKIEDSDAGVQTYLTGVYSKWIYDMFCWGYFPRMLEFDADYISGPDWYFNKFGAGNFDGEPDLTDALWKGCYGLIGRANHAQQKISEMKKCTPAVRDNAIGELKFQKAFAYFLLVRAYGPVPIQDETGTDNSGQPRQPVKDVFDYIATNLRQAAGMMYLNTDKRWEKGHVSAGSAAGLLAKVYAYQAAAAMPVGTPVTVRTGPAYRGQGSDKEYAPLIAHTMYKEAVPGYEDMDATSLYAKAAEWAHAVIAGQYGSYQLLSYDQLWKKASACESEFMFSIGSTSGDATYKNSIHTMYEGYRISTGSEFIAQGGWIGCTRHWYDLFEETDLRIQQGVKHRWRANGHQDQNLGFYYPNTGIWQTRKDNAQAPYDDGVNYYYSMDSQCLAFTTKYMDVTDNGTPNADANWPFLRYADVILTYAEAQNELGQTDEAVNSLNTIRQRSAATPATTTDQNQLRSLIIEERAKEFACEADRRWDLLRWGIYLQAMNALGGSDDSGINKTRQEKHLLFPLPKTEIDTNKNITENNPGWR
ncbi:MAG: RagB/SusD family nutrient uptake outer membrane protein [Bacteroidaceae bacterium]|nr:RagB/SusD family nutrient uptake outer membrane protein [Bacteroidaceae bacterium]